ncbi:mitotic spindle assembly checkpoint protein MAD1 [Halyomorpha halys]|uniref:mitotic spindle assembly checkpoint protein MAD1 n=1 Tax=Halyomorpha halys TaxID=286706 RepID=UPI0006D4F4C3|nr:mitotic spindle assembly checkpoint protein MAD1 [Halyomorpha halys]
MNLFNEMNQNQPSGLTRMLDDFRSGTNLQYRRSSTTNLAYPLPLPTPLTPGTQNSVKRPFDDTVLNEKDMLIKKCRQSDSILSDSSLNDSISSWEYNHVKSQLTQARAEIKTLENRIAQLHGHRKETEQLFDKEKNALKSTIEQNRNNIQQLERRVTTLKRREDKLKDEIASLTEKMNSDRSEKETKNILLYDENTELKHKISELEDQLSEKDQHFKSLQVENQRLKTDIELCNEKCNTINSELSKLRQTTSELETMKAALANAHLTIKELQSAKKSYEEMDLMVKSQQNKLMRYSELERQLKSYTQQNTKLKESCSNAVHLESVVEEMKARLTTLEERESELLKLRVDLGVAEGKLAEYRNLATEVLGTGSGAVQLSVYLRQLQTNSLLAASQQSQLNNKLKSMEDTEKLALSEISKLKQDIERLTEELATTNSNLKRLKKQNALIAWERNDLRSLIDSCQKEVTISGSHLVGDGRIELLEKLVDGYRERIKQMEADPSLITPVGSNSMYTVEKEHSTAEIEKLKKENQAYKEKIEKLEFEIDHRSLKGDFNTLNTKILHFKLNPTDEAVNNRQDELSALRKELFETKERLNLYLEGNVNDITQQIAQKEDLSKEILELREKIKSQETVNQRLKEVFKTKGHEFREAIYALLGYKVDGLPNSLYRLSSLYAESQEQHLIFKMTGNGMELLETEYSKTLAELVDDILLQHHSIPVFLSTLTIDLFKKQSHSMTMSVTSIA